MLKLSSSIKGDGPFTPPTGLAGIASMACLKLSASVVNSGSGVSQTYGQQPVWRQKSNPYLPLNCIIFLRRRRANDSAEQRSEWALVVCSNVIPISFNSFSCDTNAVKYVIIFGLLLQNHKHGIHIFPWRSFGEISMIWHWIGHIWTCYFWKLEFHHNSTLLIRHQLLILHSASGFSYSAPHCISETTPGIDSLLCSCISGFYKNVH